VGNCIRIKLTRYLVRRLTEEEEYERLIMYARDVRFERDVDRPKWERGRIIVCCMLHCLMRMNEKVLFLLYFAAMKRCSGDSSERNKILDLMTAKIRSIGMKYLTAMVAPTRQRQTRKTCTLSPCTSSSTLFLVVVHDFIDVILGLIESCMRKSGS
jgi:hypothetical protein